MGSLPMGDDTGNPHPVPVLLAGEVSRSQHAVRRQSGTQRCQGRALGGYSGQVQVSCLSLTTGHDRQGRGDGSDGGARKRGLEPCTLFPTGGPADLTVLIGQNPGGPQCPTALHSQTVQGP